MAAQKSISENLIPDTSLCTLSKSVSNSNTATKCDMPSKVCHASTVHFPNESSGSSSLLTPLTFTSESLSNYGVYFQSRPKQVTGSYGCLLCFVVMCPILLVTAAVIIRSVCLHLREEHLNRIPALCSVSEAREVNVTTWCDCGTCEGRNQRAWSCLSSYPCYVINVTYALDDVTGPAGVDGVNKSTPCSIDLLRDCYIEPEMNRKLVEEQLVAIQKMSPGFECIHNRQNTSQAFMAKDYTMVGEGKVVHCFFWPSMLILISLTWIVSITYDVIHTLRLKRQYRAWLKDQSFRSYTSSMSDDYELQPPPNNLFGRFKHFLRNQIIERDEIPKKRLKLLEQMRNRDTMVTESGQIWYRPTFHVDVQEPRPSMLIQGILTRDAEGISKRAKLDESIPEMTNREQQPNSSDFMSPVIKKDIDCHQEKNQEEQSPSGSGISNASSTRSCP